MTFHYPTDEEWLASLDDETRLRADQMIAALTELAAPEPTQWVRSEITEDIPQTAKFLLLRGIWSGIIDEYRQHHSWIDGAMDGAETDPGRSFSDAGLALRKMLDLGISRQDIATVARMVAYETVFKLLYHVNYGTDEALPQQLGDTLPGWALMECTPKREMTGRIIDGVYETLLSLDPTGREGRPE